MTTEHDFDKKKSEENVIEVIDIGYKVNRLFILHWYEYGSYYQMLHFLSEVNVKCYTSTQLFRKLNCFIKVNPFVGFQTESNTQTLGLVIGRIF